MDPVRMRLMFDALIPPTRLERVLRAASRIKARVRVQKRGQGSWKQPRRSRTK